MLIVSLVITQVFPDDFHLNTLDQFLSATARLNPHVNVKGIVIGLMDKLSSYAARDSESETVEERRKKEQEAMTKLLEKLRITKEAEETKKSEANKKDEPSDKAQINGASPGDEASTGDDDKAKETPKAETTNGVQETDGDDEAGDSKKGGITDDVKLYEIFYQQVVHLVNAQRLPIQDTIALLVSLVNLAL